MDSLRFEELVRRGTLTGQMVDFLVAAVRGRLNILISGGSGAGKTTLLNNLGRAIPRKQRVVTIEETAELSLDQPDVLSLETRPMTSTEVSETTPRDLLKNCLRLRPIAFCWNARGSEVLGLLQAMNSGNDGSMCTVHANDTAMRSRESNCWPTCRASSFRPRRPAYIASAVQILIHVGRLDSGERKVLRISELRGVSDGQYQVEDLFVFRMAGRDDEGRVQGSFYSTGIEPASLSTPGDARRRSFTQTCLCLAS